MTKLNLFANMGDAEGTASTGNSTDAVSPEFDLSDFTPAYDNNASEGVLQRMFYPLRALSARPLPEEKTERLAKLRDALISATGEENGIPRSFSADATVFFNWAREDGFIMVEIPAWKAKASLFNATGAGLGWISVTDLLASIGLTTKTHKNSNGNDVVDVPLVVAQNLIHKTSNGQGYMASMGFTVTFGYNREDKQSISADIHLAGSNGIWLSAESVEKAMKGENAGHFLPQSYMDASNALSYAVFEDLRLAVEGTARQPVEMTRRVRIEMSEVYWGANEWKAADANARVGYHGLIRRISDIAAEQMSANRRTAGLSAVFNVLNAR